MPIDETMMEKAAPRFATPIGKVGQCQACIHRRAGAKCAAFPNGIPLGIQRDEISHKEPYPCDHGVRFAPR